MLFIKVQSTGTWENKECFITPAHETWSGYCYYSVDRLVSVSLFIHHSDDLEMSYPIWPELGEQIDSQPRIFNVHCYSNRLKVDGGEHGHTGSH